MVENKLNDIVMRLKPSKTLEMLSFARQLEKSGKKVIHMELGEPDIPSPDSVKSATIDAINNNFTHYTEVRGLSELREKVISYFKSNFGADHYSADENIIVTPGAKAGMFYSLLTILREDDEVIIPSPMWGSYASVIRSVGAKPVFVDIYNTEEGFDINKIRSAVTNNTKALVINFPSNPTSQVMQKENFTKITEFIKENPTIYLLSDEIYNELTYTGNMNSFSPFKEISDQLILISGFAKSHSMTGYRLGYAIAPKYLIDKFVALQGNGSTCATAFVQLAGVKALDDHDHVKKARNIYYERSKFVVDLLSEIPDVTFKTPQAGFYAYPKIEGVKDDFTMKFLKTKFVAGTPGSAFGPYYEDFIRLSFATTEENIREGLKRLKEFIIEYRK